MAGDVPMIDSNQKLIAVGFRLIEPKNVKSINRIKVIYMDLSTFLSSTASTLQQTL